VYRESSGTDDQGMDLYFQLSWAPPERNDVALWVGGGLMYTGPIPGRPVDLAGFTTISLIADDAQRGKRSARPGQVLDL
jgi:carbohydrate-selective porin OprB